MTANRIFSRQIAQATSDRFRSGTGFSLIEVLVALVVLSIGMIGIASMQVQGLQFGQQALTNTRAIGFAADMADRIRANSGATDGAAALQPGDAYATDFTGAAQSAPFVCADTDTDELGAADLCTPTMLAAYDIWAWKTALQGASRGGLPGGKGQVEYSFSSGVAQFVVEIRWMERGQEEKYRLELRQ